MSFAIGQARVSLAIECKNLKPFFPLVVSRVPRQASEAFHELLLPEERVGHHLISLPLRPSQPFRLTTPSSVYEVELPIGKATMQLGVKEAGGSDFFADDSEVYEKWAQAVASAYGLASDAAHAFHDDDCELFAHFIAPVVVIPDGTLWVADYDNEGIKTGGSFQVNEVEFYLDHSPWRMGQMFSYTFSHLHFVTQTGLTAYISRLQSESAYFVRLFGVDPTQAAEPT